MPLPVVTIILLEVLCLVPTAKNCWCFPMHVKLVKKKLNSAKRAVGVICMACLISSVVLFAADRLVSYDSMRVGKLIFSWRHSESQECSLGSVVAVTTASAAAKTSQRQWEPRKRQCREVAVHPFHPWSNITEFRPRHGPSRLPTETCCCCLGCYRKPRLFRRNPEAVPAHDARFDP